MKLVELTPIPTGDLPLAALRAHLRLGTGFTDDDLQDPVLETALRAALAAIEARTGKLLFERSFRWTVSAWRSPRVQALPVAPVNMLVSLTVTTRTGDVTLADMSDVVLEEDTHRPLMHAVRPCLPDIPALGQAVLTFTAGYSQDWAGMPPDLAHAVLLLAAHFYELRHEITTHDGNMPFGVSSLIDRYRTVRVLGGAPA
ncbi:hypothetical protein DKT77_08940 [Meridianimarinicoccus roseus]|jgi:uncharacterized phiE125 gp8 family phage protein|uniref:PhiE125 gp8 family phage protein n=1 Tax=Meridianimarinicoccus roseus TaxID=2072018 RepID=A0A2V2LDB2_9RHOB|nr:head-tail connector protein [Meridianimarinicoccus roseus]PWR03052.1 hypothetical protein DKT77_08940 [Meridianimarinicoccus roseus]